MIGALLCAFVASWLWWRAAHPSTSAPDYALIGPITVSAEAFSVSTQIALKTVGADADWIKKNNPALRKIVETTLLSLEPQRVHMPGGLLAVQAQLLGAIQQQLKINTIEQLLLTDFVLQSDI